VAGRVGVDTEAGPRPLFSAAYYSPSAGPAGLGGAGRVPAGIAVRCPTACRRGWPLRTLLRQWGGRVAGKPGQHRSDRLGLLLVKAAASLTAQQLHLDGEPWRPRSWPSSPTAGLAGGALAGRWCGPRIRVGHTWLLARPATALTGAAAGRQRAGVSQRIPILSRSRESGRPRAPASWRPRSLHDRRRRPSAEAARRGGVERAAPPRTPATPQHGPRPDNLAGSGRPARRAARAPRNRPAPTRVAAQRLDHPPITDRSPGQRLVHRSITRHSAAPQRLNHAIPTGDTAARRAAPLHPRPGREPFVPRPAPTPFGSLQHPVNPGTSTSAIPGRSPAAARHPPSSRAVGPGVQGRSPSRASSPTSQRRPTPSSARIRFTDHPCST
jgi:hypothetical protein